MKRFYSLFFLILILLNTVGYYEVLVIIDKEQQAKTVQKITEYEDEINGNLLLKLPMSTPYGSEDTEYQRVYGEVTVEGQVYHLVKQKFYRDTLYVVCLKDTKTTNVKNVIADYSKTFADQPQKSGTPYKTITSLAKVYTLWNTISETHEVEWSNILHTSYFKNLYRFSSIASIFHPPCRINN